MEYLNIGRLVKPRGLKGEIKIKSRINFQNELFKPGMFIYIKNGEGFHSFEISQYRRINNDDFLSFKNRLHINLIEDLIGKEVYVDKNLEIPLKSNEFLVSSLIGLNVIQNAKIKGKVKDVYNYPQGDYLSVETANGEKLIPFNERFILSQSETEIEIVDMEGLF